MVRDGLEPDETEPVSKALEGKEIDLKEKRKKVMIISDPPNMTTGYGNVFKYVADHINQTCDVHFVANHYFGAPTWYTGTIDRLPRRPMKLYPQGMQLYGFDVLDRYLEHIKPDVLITLCDIGLAEGYVKRLTRDDCSKWHGKWIAYVAYDSPVWHPYFQTGVEVPDAIVTMSQFSKKVIEDHSHRKVHYIPHGVDPKVYKPLDRPALKKEFNMPRFVVGASGRNQIRKMWGKTIQGYAKFAANKGDTCFLAHTEPVPETGGESWYAHDAGWDIRSLAQLYGIENITSLTCNVSVLNRFTIGPQTVNKFYNMMDVFGFLTGGEGFGLPSLEAQAAGSVLVTTNFSSGPELTDNGKCGFLVDVKDHWVASNGIEWALADTDHFKSILNDLYDNPDKVEEYSEKAVAHAKKYDWDLINPAWDNLIKELTD